MKIISCSTGSLSKNKWYHGYGGNVVLPSSFVGRGCKEMFLTKDLSYAKYYTHGGSSVRYVGVINAFPKKMLNLTILSSGEDIKYDKVFEMIGADKSDPLVSKWLGVLEAPDFIVSHAADVFKRMGFDFVIYIDFSHRVLCAASYVPA
jgi:hypothetical protein